MSPPWSNYQWGAWPAISELTCTQKIAVLQNPPHQAIFQVFCISSVFVFAKIAKFTTKMEKCVFEKIVTKGLILKIKFGLQNW